MRHRYLAVNVDSVRGPNIYRLVGLAKYSDRTASAAPGRWPAHLVLTTENETDWVPVVSLWVSPISGRLEVDYGLPVDYGLTVEQ